MTPDPMNTMLEKQPRAEAIELWQRRKSMVVEEVPSTLAGIDIWYLLCFVLVRGWLPLLL